MKDKIFMILLGIIAVALISCEAAPPPDYSNTGTMRLCGFVLNFDRDAPYANFSWYYAALDALEERGEDCSDLLHLRDPAVEVEVNSSSN